MGVDFYAQVVIGERVLKTEEEVEVTKYDENTGKPYTKSEEKEFWIYENDSKAIQKIDSHDEELDVHVKGCDPDLECEGIYGINYGMDDEFMEINLEKISELQAKYKKLTGRDGKVFVSCYAD